MARENPSLGGMLQTTCCTEYASEGYKATLGSQGWSIAQVNAAKIRKDLHVHKAFLERRI